VEILSKAMSATFKDPEFRPYFKKIVADDASPLEAAVLRKVVAEIPRDAETIELLRIFSGPDPLPPR
jgi:hypothetical protein